MLAASITTDDFEAYLLDPAIKNSHGDVTIGCFNSPMTVTLSGSIGKIDTFEARLKADGIFVRKLKVGNAYHSSYTDTITKEYAHLTGDIESNKN